MDTVQIVSELEAVNSRLLQQIAKFNERNFNTKPSFDAWSAGEIADHLLMLARNVNRNLRARTMAAGRPPDEKVEIIITVFGDYDEKYNAPVQIIPTEEPKDLTAMLKGLDVGNKRLAEVVKSEDLTVICKGFNHPSLGAFTRLEWIYFIIHHTQRHIHQMEQVYNAVK